MRVNEIGIPRRRALVRCAERLLEAQVITRAEFDLIASRVPLHTPKSESANEASAQGAIGVNRLSDIELCSLSEDQLDALERRTAQGRRR